MTREDVFDAFGIEFPVRFEYVLADEIVRLSERLAHAEYVLECVKHEAGIWKQEARTQRRTVSEVGSALGGMPDYGPIADTVRALAAAPKVTVLDEYRLFDGYGNRLNTVEGSREYADNLAQSYRIRPYTDHPVTVRRVALLEDDK